MPDFVWGFRKGRSSEDVLIKIFEEVRSHIEVQGNVALMICLDIKKTYDSVFRYRISLALKKLGLGGPLLEALDAFLPPGILRARVNGRHTAKSGIKHSRGLMQGSLLSPKQWAVVFNIFENIGLDPSDIKAIVADDGALVLLGKDMKTLAAKAGDLLKNIAARAETLGLSLCPKKTFVYQFTSEKISAPAPVSFQTEGNPRVVLEDKSYTGSEAKYLGAVLDRELNGDLHFKYLDKKLNKKWMVFRRLAGKYSGLPEKDLVHVYKVWTRSVLKYSASVFFFGRRHLKWLKSVQKKWLCTATRTFSGSPLVGMESLTGVIPIDHFIAEAVIT